MLKVSVICRYEMVFYEMCQNQSNTWTYQQCESFKDIFWSDWAVKIVDYVYDGSSQAQSG